MKVFGSSLFSPRNPPTQEPGDADRVLGLHVMEATGLPKPCDAYCVCSFLEGGSTLDIRGAPSPRDRKSSNAQLVRTETVKKTAQPRWAGGKGHIAVGAEMNPKATVELSLMAQRLLGSELIGRAQIQLSALMEPRVDKWYSIRNKNLQESGSIRLQTSFTQRAPSNTSSANPLPDELPGPIPVLAPIAAPTPAPISPHTPQAVPPTPFPAPPSAHSPIMSVHQFPPQSPTRRPPAGGRPSSREGVPFKRGDSIKHALPPPSPSNAPVPGTAVPTTFAYKIGEMVGRGAFGKVFQAMNLINGELMAVKCVDLVNVSPEELDEIKNEVQLLRTLRHRHVVSYVGTHTMETSFNIIMEFCPGGSVASLLNSFGAFPEPVLAQYTRQIVEGLAYIHEHAVMHRDIKGANILVAANGVLKIADFGASAQLRGTVTERNDTCSMRGTPFWMAPEVIRQERYGRASDVWSTGMTVVEMATGMHPWKNATNKFSLMYEIASTDHLPEYPQDLSEQCKDFILSSIKRKVDERITAEEALRHPFLRDVQTRRPFMDGDV